MSLGDEKDLGDAHLRSLLLDIHAMTSEYCKAKKDKRMAYEARQAANPLARGPGRPRKPVLSRVDGHQEFITVSGDRVLIPCLPRESKCKASDHIKRIVIAYRRLKDANVRITVKHIRLLGIGAGTFLEHRAALPDHISAELKESSRLPVSIKQVSDGDSDSDIISSVKTKRVVEKEQEDVLYDNSPSDTQDDFFIEGLAGYQLMGILYDSSGFSNVQPSTALKRLLENQNFRNAVALVDGCFGGLGWVSNDEMELARERALFWVDEVQRQRQAHGLPAVNMRPVRQHRHAVGEGRELHRSTS